jgi:tRNA/tmRNA/rRNA uracil-C5-methylase (TrmA/RlmC/RlmD family)
VEEIAAAIDDAKKNAVRNAITSDYHFYSGRVEKICSIQDGKICIEN